MKNLLFLLALLLSSFSFTAMGQKVEDKAAPMQTIQGKAHCMNIRMVIGETSLAAMLEDSPTARDFAALLPLNLTLEDFHSAEKSGRRLRCGAGNVARSHVG
jgi:hypothetical protein